LILPNT